MRLLPWAALRSDSEQSFWQRDVVIAFWACFSLTLEARVPEFDTQLLPLAGAESVHCVSVGILAVSLPRVWIQEIKHMPVMYFTHGLFLTCTYKNLVMFTSHAL
jgi:hypothetical protein